MPDGTYTMDSALRLGPTGHHTAWYESGRQVQVKEGLFTAILGIDSPISADVFDGPRWLDIGVDGVNLAPRIQLTTSPYAFQAHTAQHVVDSADVTSLNALAGPVTLSAGDNISIQQDGNDITLSATTIPNPLPVSQSGAWNVGISGTPTFNVDSTQNTVKSQQSGMWTVGISSTINTVKTPTVSNSIQLFPSSQTLANGTDISTSFDCSGFRELRGAISLYSHSGNLHQVRGDACGNQYTGCGMGAAGMVRFWFDLKLDNNRRQLDTGTWLLYLHDSSDG